MKKQILEIARFLVGVIFSPVIASAVSFALLFVFDDKVRVFFSAIDFNGLIYTILAGASAATQPLMIMIIILALLKISQLWAYILIGFVASMISSATLLQDIHVDYSWAVYLFTIMTSLTFWFIEVLGNPRYQK